MTILLVVVGIAVVGLLCYAAWLAEKKRREALAALAGRLGWRFDSTYDRDHDEHYAHFEIFRRGHSRCAYNTLAGEVQIDGRRSPAKMGDFRYRVTRHTGKTTHTHTYRFSYLIVHLPFCGVPNLLIRREGLFDKLADAFGFDDIDFESAEFSRRFHVVSSDKRFAYDVIHARMMEFLLTADVEAFDIENGRCCVSDGRRRWDPPEFESRLSSVRRFLEMWPEHVITRFRG